MSLLRAVTLALTLALAGGLLAATVEPRQFDSPADEARYKRLIQELRCLVCQNQNIADSNADLAKDLRNQTYDMVRAGQSDEAIKAFMVNRYGDFVLYRPPVKASTAMLWYGPLLLGVIGAVVVIVLVRRRNARPAPSELSPEEQARLDGLLASHKAEDKP